MNTSNPSIRRAEPGARLVRVCAVRELAAAVGLQGAGAGNCSFGEAPDAPCACAARAHWRCATH